MIVRAWRRVTVGLLLILAACDALALPTPTVTRQLSGPTLEATGAVIPLPPSEVPAGAYDSVHANNPTAAAFSRDEALPDLFTPLPPTAASP